MDDVLSYVILTCVVSGTDFKDEGFMWWSKAALLVKKLGLNSEARIADQTPPHNKCLQLRKKNTKNIAGYFGWFTPVTGTWRSCSTSQSISTTSSARCLIHYPEWIWQDLVSIPLEDIPLRLCRLPTHVTGTGFFEYFLPLMAILGDIIELRSRRGHPLIGEVDELYLASTIGTMLANFENRLEILYAVRTPIDPIITEQNPPILPISPVFR
ncbi:hypothetical protein BDV06DRAFT_225909 [Aspergillus oleicola]